MTTKTTLGADVAEFVETFCKHHRGDLAGQNIELRPFNKKSLTAFSKQPTTGYGRTNTV